MTGITLHPLSIVWKQTTFIFGFILPTDSSISSKLNKHAAIVDMSKLLFRVRIDTFCWWNPAPKDQVGSGHSAPKYSICYDHTEEKFHLLINHSIIKQHNSFYFILRSLRHW
jgi:hypothetical protein